MLMGCARLIRLGNPACCCHREGGRRAEKGTFGRRNRDLRENWREVYRKTASRAEHSEHFARGSVQKSDSLRWFLTEFIVNNPNFNCPIDVGNGVLLIRKAVEETGGSLSVAETYQLTVPVVRSDTEWKELKRSTRIEVVRIFCSGWREREDLFRGYGNVGLVQRLSDQEGKPLYEMTVSVADCESKTSERETARPFQPAVPP